MIRKYTNKIINLVDDGVLDADYQLRQLLVWMSEDEVKEFWDRNLADEFESEEE